MDRPYRPLRGLALFASLGLALWQSPRALLPPAPAGAEARAAVPAESGPSSSAAVPERSARGEIVSAVASRDARYGEPLASHLLATEWLLVRDSRIVPVGEEARRAALADAASRFLVELRQTLLLLDCAAPLDPRSIVDRSAAILHLEAEPVRIALAVRAEGAAPDGLDLGRATTALGREIERARPAVLSFVSAEPRTGTVGVPPECAVPVA